MSRVGLIIWVLVPPPNNFGIARQTISAYIIAVSFAKIAKSTKKQKQKTVRKYLLK